MFDDLEIPQFLRDAALQSAKQNITIIENVIEEPTIDISRFYKLKANTITTSGGVTLVGPDAQIGSEILSKMKKSDAIRHLGKQGWQSKRISSALGITYSHAYVILRNAGMVTK